MQYKEFNEEAHEYALDKDKNYPVTTTSATKTLDLSDSYLRYNREDLSCILNSKYHNWFIGFNYI